MCLQVIHCDTMSVAEKTPQLSFDVPSSYPVTQPTHREPKPDSISKSRPTWLRIFEFMRVVPFGKWTSLHDINKLIATPDVAVTHDPS
jgi:hypothetical protein